MPGMDPGSQMAAEVTSKVFMDEVKKEKIESLGGGIIRITWIPADVPIPEELEYLAEANPLPMARTNAMADKKTVEFSYLFTKEGGWYGIICPKKVWKLFKMASAANPDKLPYLAGGWTKEDEEAFEALNLK